MYKTLCLSLLLILTMMTEDLAQKKDYVVTIKTNLGDMVAILYDDTPKHKENFIKLAKEHYFDSVLFHRVISGFMIQGGDPDSKKAKPGQRLGSGGPGYTIEAEFHSHRFHEKGALSAARLGGPSNPTKASSGSQFYIVQGTVIPQQQLEDMKINQEKMNETFGPWIQKPENKAIYDSLSDLYRARDMQGYQAKITSLIPRVEKETGVKLTKDISPEKIKTYSTVGGTPFLDDDYTVFGKVIKGLDVVDKIAAVQKDGADRPLEDVRMTVTVEEMSRKHITKEYGYIYPEVKK